MYGKKIKEIKDYVNSLSHTVSRDRKYLESEIDTEHNRISVLAPKVDMLVIENMKLRQDISSTKDLAERLLGILQRSGILEEAVDGNDLFQMHSTVDTLRRYPLYKINKVVTKCRA